MSENENQPGEAQPGKPEGEGKPAAGSNEQGGKDEYLAIRNRAIDAERKLAAYEAKTKKDEDARLAEQGKHQELAVKFQKEAGDWQQKWTQERRNNALIAAGAKAGVIDPSDLVLAKLGDVDVGDEAALRDAADKAVAKLKESKAYLFGGSGKNGTHFPTPNANPGNTRSGYDPSRPPTSDQIRAMTPEQFAEWTKAKDSHSRDPLSR